MDEPFSSGLPAGEPAENRGFLTHDIEEAAQLADRVLVLSNRPATICRELCLGALRPGNLTDPAVIEALKEILKELGLHTF